MRLRTKAPDSHKTMNGVARLSKWWQPRRLWSATAPIQDDEDGVGWEVAFRHSKRGAAKAWRLMGGVHDTPRGGDSL